MKFVEHPDFADLADHVSRRLRRLTARALDVRGTASLALAGGSTPMPVYHALAAERLDWPRVSLVPGDERWVAETHAASNISAIRRAFADCPADFGALVPSQPERQPSTVTAERTLDRIAWPFDACILGMGNDGHFASLFPGAPELDAALDPDALARLTVIHPDPLPPDAPHPRISLTLAAIADSREILLLLRGRGKRHVLETALADGDPHKYPIAALLAMKSLPMQIHWSP
ncbi:MAG: 6-phosphogluconolactonase [Candidatus Wenzhouxiangella sp. M2_3B_020]